VKLPASSAWLVWLLGLTQSPWCLVGAAVVVSAAYLGARSLWREQRPWLDRLALRIPLLGDVIRKMEIVRFCDTLATLYSCGIPLTVGLRSVQEGATNTEMRKLVGDAIEGIIDGRSLSEVLAGPLFPPAVVSMVSVGEQAGRLDQMLDKVAGYLDVEVRAAVEGCAAALEPIMIVMLGGVVTVIILTAFAPLYQLLAQLG
jgi:type IV pilus assembly protein PilC